MLEHGGNLRQAVLEYGIPLADWLDLSTGINPNGWPVPAIPPQVWQRLPEDDDGLIDAACACYGAPHALPVAGSQAAIQALPRLFPPRRVGVVRPGYAEHAHAWRAAGHEVVAVDPARPKRAGLDVLLLIHPNNPTGQTYAHAWQAAGHEVVAVDPARPKRAGLDVLLLIHPNNPTGQTYAPATLLDWRERLAARGGCLIVDEAFMDCAPAQGLAAHAGLPGLVVLRSLGKFFGLAGARVGFVLAAPELLARLAEPLGPWGVAGPARHVARLALQDGAWQAAARRTLLHAGQRLAALLAHSGLPPAGGTALFQWVRTAQAPEIQHALAQRGVWVRRFEDPASLRFGLPGSEAGWARLAHVLDEIRI